MSAQNVLARDVDNALQTSGEVIQKGADIINATVTNLTAVHEWGDLLVGPYNESQSDEWRREWIQQYRTRHQNDPEVKYAVVIFYLIMVGSELLQARQSALYLLKWL